MVVATELRGPPVPSVQFDCGVKNGLYISIIRVVYNM